VIKGNSISLRPVAEADLEQLYSSLIDLESRGPWYPMPGTSLTKFRAEFEEGGFWSPDDGIFVMVGEQDRMVGMVGWDKLNSDVSDMELSYRVFDSADRGRGIATEGLELLAGWLFDSQPINRMRLVIHIDNVGSRRVAEKCGFAKEGTSREGWYHKGKWHDVDVYSLTRAECDARRKDR
jgi:[ribosomal protein S5]-alanine N-acetyltransferase